MAIGGRSNSKLPRGLWRELERKIIDEREKETKENPELKLLDPWNLSRVFYVLRKTLQDKGYNVTDLVYKREKIHNYVKEYCDKKRIKRHDIGIFAADRALLAYRGKLYSVGIEKIVELAKLGTDIICIEKKNIVDRLVRFTSNFGIALIQSQGFMSEYGAMLVQEAKKNGANVAILTDFDDSGVLLGYQLEGVVRFGIDPDTINEINIILEQQQMEKTSVTLLEEQYKRSDKNPTETDDKKQNHWKVLKDLVDGWYKYDGDNQHYRIWDNHHMVGYHNYLKKKISSDGSGEMYFEYLENRRIELDSLLTFVPIDIFWIWLRNKILQAFPKRDHNRTVNIRQFVFTSTMKEFITRLEIYLSKKLTEKKVQTRINLNREHALIDLDKKEKKINNSMFSYLLDDIEIMYLDSALRDFMDQYLHKS